MAPVVPLKYLKSEKMNFLYLFCPKNKKYDFCPTKVPLLFSEQYILVARVEIYKIHSLSPKISHIPTAWYPCKPARTTRSSNKKTSVRFVISMVYNRY